jgi:YegS/Rv2252/BmrU family lipid kinase
MQPLLVLSNAAAGSADETVLDKVLATLRPNAEVRSEPLGHPAELDALLGRYPGHRPVAAGGDGTLHLLVAALHARGELADRVLGLVPMGTGNDMARTLGIPHEDPVAAARVVVHGAVRRLDLLTDDDGGVVVNAVHLGIGAQASADGEPLKPVLGRLAYRVGAVLAGARSRGWPLAVVVDGRDLTEGRPVLQVGIGNGRTIGGGTPLTPDAAPDDGLAEVVVSTATGPVARFRYARLLLDGRHTGHPAVTVARGRVVEVSGDRTPINSDGELGEAVTRRRWTVQPGAWQVTVPASDGG